MSIHVMYYGMLAEITGQASEAWLIDEHLTVGKFRTLILEKYPLLQGKKFKIAVNKHISDDFMPIAVQSEVALLPPFAGG
jgi:molybdopterin synthase sulfur carrier subunit